MHPLLRNSTAQATITLVDVDGERITDAVVSVSIVRPDSLAQTVTSLPLVNIGNGVYTAKVPKIAFPIVGNNYRADWSIVSADDEENPSTFFDVHLG